MFMYLECWISKSFGKLGTVLLSQILSNHLYIAGSSRREPLIHYLNLAEHYLTGGASSPPPPSP